MKNQTQVFLAAASTCIASIILGYFLGSSKASPQPRLDSENQVLELKQKLQELHDVDLEDYHQLASMRDRYNKANEILAKMMTIFLADLSLRINPKVIDDLNIQQSSNLDSQEDCPSSEARQCPKCKKCSSLAEMAERHGMTLQPKRVKIREWQTKESKISQVHSESDIQEFLKSVEIPNFFEEIKDASTIEKHKFRKITGQFEGELIYDDSNYLTAHVFLDLNAEYQDGKIMGENKIVLSRKGKPFSNSTGSGRLKNYKKITGSEDGLFLELGGNTGFFQLYFLNGEHQIIGNFYKPEGVGKYIKAGTARLERK